MLIKGTQFQRSILYQPIMCLANLSCATEIYVAV